MWRARYTIVALDDVGVADCVGADINRIHGPG
jgi:hypothetical protein